MFVKVIYFHYICAINPSDMEDINRIKVPKMQVFGAFSLLLFEKIRRN